MTKKVKMPFLSKWPSQNCFERFESNMSIKLSTFSDYIGGKELRYEALEEEMTNSKELPKKKKTILKTIRGFFKKKKTEVINKKSVLTGDVTTDYGIVVFEDIDMNPALDPIDDGLERATLLTDFKTKMDDDHSYVNLGFIGKMDKSESMNSAGYPVPRPRLTRQNAVVHGCTDNAPNGNHGNSNKQSVMEGAKSNYEVDKKTKDVFNVQSGN